MSKMSCLREIKENIHLMKGERYDWHRRRDPVPAI